MTQIRAVFFDFGGTLFDYATIAPGERESIIELARWGGVEADPQVIRRAYRAALERVFAEYLPRAYYLHRDLSRAVLHEMTRSFAAALTEDHLTRYWTMQRQRHARDFVLREGVRETLSMLRARGIHVGLVSNIDDDQLTHLLALARIEEQFDSILSSEQARSCKPDPSIFSEALRRAGCPPHEVLFVGDSLQQDIAGANRVGLRSVLIWSDPDRAPPAGEHQPRHVIRQIPEVLDLIP
jgi:putative hydrolase of the HAD superfamily